MNMSAREQVDQLAEIVGWTGGGHGGIDWEVVEKSLGLPVPQDFKELINRFPPGRFQGAIRLSVPDDHGNGTELTGGLKFVLEDMRQWRQDEPERFPFPLYPEKGGVVPWACGSHGETFFWLAGGPDPDKWQVVGCEFSEMRWEIFPMSATQFITGYVTGSLNSTLFAVSGIERPSFEPFNFDDDVDDEEVEEGGPEFSLPEPILSLWPPSNEASSLISAVGRARRRKFAWNGVESRLSVRLPSDYKELMDALGAGSFRDLHVPAPNWPNPDYDLFSLIRNTREAAHAEKLIPWGWTDDGLTFVWDAGAGDPDGWNVYLAQPGFLAYRLLLTQDRRLSMTGVVARYVADPLSIAPNVVNPLTKTVVDPRTPAALPPFTPAPE
ncbi:hypothetical protein [Actinoallomurus iriomotensis]|uniref:Knr4/Smi1-like domain-containing protein n=1 Tax=Actinoallomurus iriomotensis TaxID=478107 RepID=A0A9W6VTS4_9ACTN|nr:hypothetical protein [Actinoallomurus iriomotensis]GLY80045.1 hypothetical protein Airi01_083120 [Actinoallomurus iriomotensis]